jgi:DivIVA domain-containing protein
MALTPEQVVEKRFQATKFREGYDQDEVDDFLDEVVGELRRLNAENDELRNKLAACERRVGELTRSGATAAQPVVAPTPTPEPEPEPEAEAEPEPEPEPERQPEPQPVAAMAVAPSGVPGQGPEAATGMLALAQKLHDEHVRSGEEKRDQLIREAEAHAARLVNEAEQKQRETLGSLERERSLLERKIDELRAFERDYRARLKSYLESQLRDLESKGSIVPARGPQSGQGEPGYSFGS